MNTFIYKLAEENERSQYRAQRYNPATVLLWKYGRKRYRSVLGIGRSDEVEAFRSGMDIIVVSRNCSMGYVGAESFPLVYIGEIDTEIDSKRITVPQSNQVFFQNAAEELSEDIPNWEECGLRHLARKLAQWLY